MLKLGEEQVIERIRHLKRLGIIRQISAIFNTGALGYQSSLVAMAVPAERLEEAAEVINAYPGVSHNYLRPGRYNMWYTIAVPPGTSIEEVVGRLTRAAGGWPTLILPALKKYKLAVVLDILQDTDNSEQFCNIPMTETSATFVANKQNILMVRCVQEDLPLVSAPFALWAQELGLSEAELLGRLKQWINCGFIRRFAALLDHRRIGFKANGMIVWSCPEDQIDRLGYRLASFSEVSHCYHRAAQDDWPYNLYAMVHGRNLEQCRNIARRLARKIGIENYRIMVSTREFKKIRLKLFWDEPAYPAWCNLSGGRHGRETG